MLRGTIEVAENVFGWPVWVTEKLAAALMTLNTIP
jgi:hypothetical protein